MQPDDSQLRGELPLPSLTPRACPTTQNQAHPKHGKDMDALAESANQQEGKKGNCSSPRLPTYKGRGNRGTWLLPAKEEWESSRKGWKWEEQKIIYIKKVT